MENETCDSRLVELQSNKIVRDKRGTIIGRLYDSDHVESLGEQIEELERQNALYKKSNDVFTKENYSRFWSKVNVLKKRQCWEWQSYISPQGYGKFSIDNYPYSSHVVSYVYFNGDYDRALFIDHICMNRKCVNPNHLRLVTPRVNALENSNSVSAKNSRKTHCINGHEFSSENTKIRKSSIDNSKHRVCLVCKSDNNKKHSAIRKLARETKRMIDEE